MILQKLIDQWLELIRKSKHHRQEIIDKIITKHGGKASVDMVMSLGDYNDYLAAIDENDEYFMQHMTTEYGYTEGNWNNLEKDLT